MPLASVVRTMGFHFTHPVSFLQKDRRAQELVPRSCARAGERASGVELSKRDRRLCTRGDLLE